MREYEAEAEMLRLRWGALWCVAAKMWCEDRERGHAACFRKAPEGPRMRVCLGDPKLFWMRKKLRKEELKRMQKDRGGLKRNGGWPGGEADAEVPAKPDGPGGRLKWLPIPAARTLKAAAWLRRSSTLGRWRSWRPGGVSYKLKMLGGLKQRTWKRCNGRSRGCGRRAVCIADHLDPS